MDPVQTTINVFQQKIDQTKKEKEKQQELQAKKKKARQEPQTKKEQVQQEPQVKKEKEQQELQEKKEKIEEQTETEKNNFNKSSIGYPKQSTVTFKDFETDLKNYLDMGLNGLLGDLSNLIEFNNNINKIYQASDNSLSENEKIEKFKLKFSHVENYVFNMLFLFLAIDKAAAQNHPREKHSTIFKKKLWQFF